MPAVSPSLKGPITTNSVPGLRTSTFGMLFVRIMLSPSLGCCPHVELPFTGLQFPC